jgi:penicillin-binding protein 1A
VTPYGITKVTADGVTIYEHEVDQSHVLVAPFVAAQMTDLLQTAVNTGTGKAAQIGRPVAGKTGTTTSAKDGWFVGFSSGLTTGVWMGRDDAHPIPGLHGGTAPARAFAAFMKPATANRPVEPFSTQLVLPDLELDNQEQSYFGEPDNGLFVDDDGNPIQQPAPGGEQQQEGPLVNPDEPPQPGPADRNRDQKQERLDQDWINRVTGRPANNNEAPPRPEFREPPRASNTAPGPR